MPAALLALLLIQQYTAPEGPDGIVYKEGYTVSRFAVLRKGKLNPWQFKGYPGNGGQRVTLAPAELAQVEANLKKIAALVEATPYAQSLTGWYADRSAGWINTRFPEEGMPLNRLPVRAYYGFYPFHLMDIKKKVNGVEEWAPDWRQETASIHYYVNPEITGPPGSLILHKDHEDGGTTRFYADPQPETAFHGHPVYDGTLVIGRKGRALFRPVSLERALTHFLPLYERDRKTAEDRLAELKRKQQEVESPEFARQALEEFEKEYGRLKASSPRDYEFRLKVRNDWVARQRSEARAAANLAEGSAEGVWYWKPVRAHEEMQRLGQAGGLDRHACFERVPDADALYSTKGYLRAAGSSASCKAVMEVNPGYWDAKLPRTAAQLITLWQVSRCLDTSKNPPPPLPDDPVIPHGCNVHVKIWEQLDWKALEALLAP